MILTEDKFSEAWVKFNEDEQYKIRYVSPQKISETLKKNETKSIGEYEDDLFDHIIVDWKGVYGSENDKTAGNVLECNRENKILLISNFADRKDFLMKKANRTDTFYGEIEKN